MNTGTVLTYSVHNSTKLDQGRREGGGGAEGANCPGTQSFLCVKYFRAKDKISGFFFAKYRNLAKK